MGWREPPCLAPITINSLLTYPSLLHSGCIGIRTPRPIRSPNVLQNFAYSAPATPVQCNTNQYFMEKLSEYEERLFGQTWVSLHDYHRGNNAGSFGHTRTRRGCGATINSSCLFRELGRLSAAATRGKAGDSVAHREPDAKLEVPGSGGEMATFILKYGGVFGTTVRSGWTKDRAQLANLELCKYSFLCVKFPRSQFLLREKHRQNAPGRTK